MKQAALDDNQISTEAAWVEAAQGGDKRAYEQLYRRHAGKIHGLCWRICGGQQALAEELTQEAFIRAWQKLGTFKGNSRFSTWLHRVAVNVALSDRRIRLRKVERETALDERILDQSKAPERDTGSVMDLEQAISRLPERARSVLVLHDVEGYMHQDIAEQLNMAVGTSKAQLHRARRLLREYLQQ